MSQMDTIFPEDKKLAGRKFSQGTKKHRGLDLGAQS